MAKHRLGILAFLSLRVGAVTLDAAPSTTLQPSSTTSFSPLPTTPPTYDLSPEICGWIDYKLSNSYTCAGNNTCLWNSDLTRVGCGRTDSIIYYTSCVPYYAFQFCDSSCFANPSIIKCGSEIPHCATALVGSMDNYSILACQSGWGITQYSVHLTYDGETTLEYLPRYLGNDSSITYGTRTPPSVTNQGTPVASTATSATTTGTNAFAYFITPSPDFGDNHHRHGNWTPTDWIASYNRAQRKKEIIVGTVIGGFMFLLASSLGCWFVYAWRKRLKLRALEEEKRRSEVGLQRLERDGTASRCGETDVTASITDRESVAGISRDLDVRRHSESRALEGAI